MRIRLLAAGTRMPGWVEAGVQEYARRFPANLRFEIKEIPLGKRAGAGEGERMLAAIGPQDYAVALDVRGRSLSSEELASWLGKRMQSGRDMVLMIGGPEGLAPWCLQRADFKWSLSSLTLPHALVRIVVAEQLYRALSILKGHPYHRA